MCARFSEQLCVCARFSEQLCVCVQFQATTHFFSTKLSIFFFRFIAFICYIIIYLFWMLSVHVLQWVCRSVDSLLKSLPSLHHVVSRNQAQIKSPCPLSRVIQHLPASLAWGSLWNQRKQHCFALFFTRTRFQMQFLQGANFLLPEGRGKGN